MMYTHAVTLMVALTVHVCMMLNWTPNLDLADLRFEIWQIASQIYLLDTEYVTTMSINILRSYPRDL